MSSNAPHINCSNPWHKRSAGRLRIDDRDDAKTGLRHRFHFVPDVPLHGANADVRVNFLACWEWDGDEVQPFSWVTDLRVHKGTVSQIMRGGRARWRIENETFNTLKNQGYHFEHNFGHGYQHLSVVLAVLRMLVCFVDQTQQLCCPLFQAVWAKLGSKRRLWERLRAVFLDDVLESMQHLLKTLFYGLKKSTPVLDFDSSSFAPRRRTNPSCGAMASAETPWLWRSCVSTKARSGKGPSLTSVLAAPGVTKGEK